MEELCRMFETQLAAMRATITDLDLKYEAAETERKDLAERLVEAERVAKEATHPASSSGDRDDTSNLIQDWT